MIIPIYKVDDQIWRDLIAFNVMPNRYIISNFANIIDKYTNTEIERKLYETGPKYYIVSLQTNTGRLEQYFLHRIMASVFCPIKKEGYDIVNHKNGIKLDCASYNVEWSTPKLNAQHAVETGLFKIRGEDNATAKLKNDQVHRICKLMETGMKYGDILIEVGLEVTDKNLDILTKIRTKHIWSFISDQYNIPDKEYREKQLVFSDEEIKTICECIQKGYSLNQIADTLDLDISNYKDADRFNHIVSRIKKRITYKHISENYDW